MSSPTALRRLAPGAACVARLAPLALLAVLAAACTRRVDTLPPVLRPDAAVRSLELEVPAHMEVRSVDFDATMYGDVSGAGVVGGSTTTSVGGRAFVKVMAVDTRTRETYLLVYEDITRRRQPALVVRLRPAP